jgi:hypothetical protein
MSNSISNTDLDYLREIAESGQNAPLLGGRFLVWWGALTTLAYAGHYAIAAGIMGGGGSAYGWLWGTYMLLGMGGQFFLVRSMSPAKPGASSMGNRAERVVWQAAGFALFGYFVSLIIKSLVTGTAAMGLAYSFAVVFIVYGVPLITTGVLGESVVLQRAGITALCLVPVAAWFTGTPISWLIAAIGAALCVFLPGLMLLRNEPQDVE